VSACPHVPPDYKFVVKETTKEALIYHDGVNAHLIIRTGFASEGDFPKSMAWIIPLPSVPSSYKVEDPKLFRELFEWCEPLFERAYPRAGVVSFSLPPVVKGIKVHDTVMVGNYEISPIEILSPDAGTELNGWLGTHGFNTVSPELQKFYLHPGAAFLAIRLKDLQGRVTDLKPLHIVYKSDKAAFPLKFSSGSGQFDVFLYTLTPGPSSPERYWRYGFLGGISSRLDDIKAEKKLKTFYKAVGRGGFYLTQYKVFGMNPGRSLQYLQDDPGLEASEALLEPFKQGKLYQTAPIKVLVDGHYDGVVSVGEIKKRGDFGLGSFDGLDGELVATDGHVYQAVAGGFVMEAQDSQTIPWAALTFFHSQKQIRIEDTKDMAAMETTMAGLLPQRDSRIYAIRVDGSFEDLKLRAVPKQTKPYPPFAEALKTQAVLDLHHVQGSMVGFYCPTSVGADNVPGYHFHFVSQDRRLGGHVLGYRLRAGQVQVSAPMELPVFK
jgi:acetolactate decarboxylase